MATVKGQAERSGARRRRATLDSFHRPKLYSEEEQPLVVPPA